MKWTVWRAALLDLDGTLYRGNQSIDGAAEFVQRLREAGIQPAFVTNNSTRTPYQVVEKLRTFDIQAHADEVFTSSQMAASIIREKVGRGSQVAALGQDGLEQALRNAGLEPLMAQDMLSSDERDARSPGRVQDVQGVVVGLDTELTYKHLAWICNYITQIGEWVLTNGDVRLPHGDGFLPGNGAVASLITTATGVRPENVGKPNPDFIAFVLQAIGVSNEQAVVIGDNLATDIAAATAANVESVLVQTGVVYNDHELSQRQGLSGSPTYQVASVADLLK